MAKLYHDKIVFYTYIKISNKDIIKYLNPWNTISYHEVVYKVELNLVKVVEAEKEALEAANRQ